MLKGIKKIILLIILLIPFMVIADENYQTSINYANSYIDGFVDYQNYILFPESGYYYDETLKNDNFNHGGFLSRKEYLITNYNNKSYLSPGVQYWTLTPGLSNNNKRYVIDYTDKEYEKTNMSGVRVTEFILPRTRVNGNGTRSNPWYFLPKYKLILSTTDYKKGGISDKLGNGCNNPNQILTTSIYEDENIDIQLCPSSGYEYYNTDCSINISKLINTHMIRVSNVKSNLSCKINFIVTVYKISLDTNGGSKIDTKELYLAPNRYWFKEKDDRITETQITKLDKLPTKTGYTFNGFYLDKTSDIKLIDEAGNLISTSGYTTDGTMYARYTANKYTVKFDQQEGKGGTPSVTATYDSKMPTITKLPTREGYKFAGYYTEKGGLGTKYYNANGTSANIWNIASNKTLYAYWTPNKLNIIFNANGATIKKEVELKGTKYYWQLNENGNIMRSKDNNNNYIESFYSRNYTENINLPNYNYSDYIKLTKTGYTALSGKEWCTNPDGSGECFDQTVDYSAEKICPSIVSGDCNITLYTNWELDNTKYNCIYDGYLMQGAEYVNGQYTYRYKQKGVYYTNIFIWKDISADGWGVQLTDKASTEPVTSELCSSINGKPIVSMSYMFANSQATSLDLSSFNTSNVTDMSYMFWSSQATSLDLSSFDTSSVTNMRWMFTGSQATTLDLSSFNTSNVTNMSSMFSNSEATTLDLSNFNTSNVTTMFQMFCRSQATEIKGLENFNTSKVTDMREMFYESQATSLDLSSFDTSNVTHMREMFKSSQATSLDLSSFDTSNVLTMAYMFDHSQATSLDLSSFNTSKVVNMYAMFWASQATTLDLSGFDTSNVTNMSLMFYDSQATSLDLSNFNTSKVTDMSYMFSYSKATSLDLSSFDTSNVTDMSRMFEYSKATKGYARTQTDANKFNSTSGKPSRLKFVIK
ncbi:MAG: BspA family leucine-rich repeat surface protein [bacterium]|nr:BspA family leucine-rich repeat surface protein [bacterium]